jgi:HlyD family secretion protein
MQNLLKLRLNFGVKASRDMKRYLFLLPFIGLVSCNNNGEVVSPVEKPLVEAVYASGHVVARNQYQVFALADGYVLEKTAEDGTEVSQGSPLFILESGQQSSRFDLAKKNWTIASTNYRDDSPVLAEIVSAMDAARTKVKFDSINYVRYKNLLDQNATSRGEVDRMRLAYDNSRSELLLQKSRYQQIKNRLYLELENARSQLDIAGNESGKYIIRSEANGIVFQTLKEKGELIRRGEPVAVIGDKSAFYLELSVDELDIHRLKRGQEVVVTIDALPGKVYKATVDKIYPMVNRQQQSVQVDATLQDSIPVLVSGLAVEANIIIHRKDKALVIPKAAVSGRDSLWIRTEKGKEKIRIRRGIETLEEVEILEGVTTDSEILLVR